MPVQPIALSLQLHAVAPQSLPVELLAAVSELLAELLLGQQESASLEAQS